MLDICTTSTRNRQCFILASSDDRIHLLTKCIESAKKSRYKDCDFFLYYQGSERSAFDSAFFRDVVWDSELRGVFTPRYELMKRYCLGYDYTILIDDDLFMQPETTYERSIEFCDAVPGVGAISIIHNKSAVKNEIRCVSGTSQYFNVSGGMVFPRKSIGVILEYFSEKERDYTEDVVWLLLYAKGYDLYKDFSSYSIHMANRKSKRGALTGYNKMRVEKPHIPMLEEWYEAKRIYQPSLHAEVWKLKEMTDINDAGRMERERCYEMVHDPFVQ